MRVLRTFTTLLLTIFIMVSASAVTKDYHSQYIDALRKDTERILENAKRDFRAAIKEETDKYSREKKTDKVKCAMQVYNNSYTLYFKSETEMEAFKYKFDNMDQQLQSIVNDFINNCPKEYKNEYISWLKPHINEFKVNARIIKKESLKKTDNKTGAKDDTPSAKDRRFERPKRYMASNSNSPNSSSASTYDQNRGTNTSTAASGNTTINSANTSANTRMLRNLAKRTKSPKQKLKEGMKAAILADNVYENKDRLPEQLNHSTIDKHIDDFIKKNNLPNDSTSKKKLQNLYNFIVASENFDGKVYGTDLSDSEGSNGFFSSIYFDEETATFTIAFRGTSNLMNLAGVDNMTNFGNQYSGEPTPQMNKAYEIGMMLLDLPEDVRSHFQITGHSLGGGLASLTAAISGVECNTFNAEGIPQSVLQHYAERFVRETEGIDDSKNIENDESLRRKSEEKFNSMFAADNITAYHSSNDFLTAIQSDDWEKKLAATGSSVGAQTSEYVKQNPIKSTLAATGVAGAVGVAILSTLAYPVAAVIPSVAATGASKAKDSLTNLIREKKAQGLIAPALGRSVDVGEARDGVMVGHSMAAMVELMKAKYENASE